LRVTYSGLFHKVDRSFGPFDLFECLACGSLGTEHPPTPERLTEFYRAYHLHRPDWYKKAAASGALLPQYESYARFLKRRMPAGEQSHWADIGAGHGEVANLLAASLAAPRGCAVDITGRPVGLDERLEYRTLDINAPGWVHSLGRTFDLVYSVAVWEHVLDPLIFAREALSLVSKRGALVLICPDYGSAARRLLGRSWPYFEPGEHLTMPTSEGAAACLRRAAAELGLSSSEYHLEASGKLATYSLRYVLNVLRLDRLASVLPPMLSAALPTGLLATVVRLKG